MKEYAITICIVFNNLIWWTETKNITAAIDFVLMVKIDILETCWERHPSKVTLRHLQDVFGMLPKRSKAIKPLTLFQRFRHTFCWNKIGNNVMKSDCKRGSKLTFWRCPKDVTLWTSFLGRFEEVHRTVH